MISASDPWAEIPVAPTSQYSRLRVRADNQCELFWFRDEVGRPGLFIEISPSVPTHALKDARISIRYIAVDVIEVKEENLRVLKLMLEDNRNQDVFLKLCLDLIERVDTTHKDDIFYSICKRLLKWKALLAGGSKTLLSKIEIQGLFSEVHFIGELLKTANLNEYEAIDSWEGPQGTQQDFILKNQVIEIKSVGANQRRKVRISSEDQLDSHIANLYLRVYFVSETGSPESGESLNEVVRRISKSITLPESIELFETKLDLAGYIDIADYDEPRFIISDVRTYLISSKFPRITRQTLPEGIDAVSYDISLAAIENFRVKSEQPGD